RLPSAAARTTITGGSMTDGGGAGPAVSSEPDRGVGGRESGVSWASAMAAPPSSKSVRIACFIRVSAPSLQPELDRQKDPRRDGLCLRRAGSSATGGLRRPPRDRGPGARRDLDEDLAHATVGLHLD